MAESAVDTSPLIFLSRAGWIHLLRLESPSLVVPEPVARELQARGLNDPATQALNELSWLRVVASPSVPAHVGAFRLGPGESAVLAWCLAHRPAVAVLDDLAGRKAAESLGIPVRGTLGLVLLAKKRGVVTAARPILEDLVRAGMFLSTKVLDRALRIVGE